MCYQCITAVPFITFDGGGGATFKSWLYINLTIVHILEIHNRKYYVLLIVYIAKKKIQKYGNYLETEKLRRQKLDSDQRYLSVLK